VANHSAPATGVGAGHQQAQVSIATALGYWLKLGFVSFGGPAGQIAIMHQELVERRRWISEQRFLHALNYCMLLPGPEAQQLATYIGWLMHGVKGGLIAGTLFVLPSLLILIALSWLYMAFGNTPVLSGVLYGIKPAVTAVVAFAAWRIGKRALKNGFLWAIAAAAFVAIFFFHAPFPLIVIAAAIAGAVAGKLRPSLFRTDPHAQVDKGFGPAVIDDLTPLPSHAKLSRLRIAAVAAVGIGLWAAIMVLLGAESGWQSTLTQMGWFFTKAALVTFGGAYAVLPYVYQGAVEHYGWLPAAAMIDGLALGETTPGPLIMVVAFVGFVGGWNKALFGPEALALAGMSAAAVATFFTFLPSFLFILVGGPLIEATRGNLAFTAPLTGITAAVVGVIVNLAVFFAWHVLWPHASPGAPFGGGFEWFSLLLGVFAFLALRFDKAGVIPVIGACALLGLGYKLALGAAR
jgi:chromate transporter